MFDVLIDCFGNCEIQINNSANAAGQCGDSSNGGAVRGRAVVVVEISIEAGPRQTCCRVPVVTNFLAGIPKLVLGIFWRKDAKRTDEKVLN